MARDGPVATTSGSDAHFTRTSPEDSRGITTTVETRFVDSNGVVVVPPSTYNTNLTGNDTPPSELVDVLVTTSWANRSEENTYSLESLISSVGQTPPVSENGCANASESGVDVMGAILIADTGTAEPYTPIVNGVLGEAHSSEVYPCNSILTASGKGGLMAIVNGSYLHRRRCIRDRASPRLSVCRSDQRRSTLELPQAHNQ